MTAKEMAELVGQLTDDERMKLVAACASAGLIIPDWYSRESFGKAIGKDISREVWKEFCEQMTSWGIADDMFESLQLSWCKFAGEDEDDED